MLEHRQLLAFLHVAEEHHFSRAAERLGIAQPILSGLIKKLEEELGVRLFQRNKRSAVTLTTAGELFAPEARAAVIQLEKATLIGRMAARGEAGIIKIAYVGSAVTSGTLATLLKKFHCSLPDARVRLSALDTPTQLSGLLSRTLDVGLIRARTSYPEGLSTKIVHSERLVIAMSELHELSMASEILPKMLRNELFIAPQFSEVGGFATNLRNLGNAGSFEPSLNQQVGDFTTALCLASAGYGVVLIPQSMRAFAPAGVVFREITDFADMVSLAAVWRNGENARIVHKFIKSTSYF